MQFLGVHMPAQISAFKLPMMFSSQENKKSLMNAMSLGVQSTFVHP